MILHKGIIRNSPNTGLGEAFKALLASGTPDDRKIWQKYIAEVLDRDYDQLLPLMDKIFRMMKQREIGIDYELFYQAMDVWDEGDKEIRLNISRTVFGGQGGFRPNAGAKSHSADGPKLPLGISRVAPDVAAILADSDTNKTEYVERAIRFYHQHKNDGTLPKNLT